MLIVDDDIRNIFALTSVLERAQHEGPLGRDRQGRDRALHGTPDIDVVLMDIMMPEHGRLRHDARDPQHGEVPELCRSSPLTAKAMKGDREKCIEAGASDYIAKPVDTEQCSRCCGCWLTALSGVRCRSIDVHDDERRSTSCSSTTTADKLLALEAVLADLDVNAS